jgi:hypothetical protein
MTVSAQLPLAPSASAYLRMKTYLSSIFGKGALNPPLRKFAVYKSGTDYSAGVTEKK